MKEKKTGASARRRAQESEKLPARAATRGGEGVKNAGRLHAPTLVSEELDEYFDIVFAGDQGFLIIASKADGRRFQEESFHYPQERQRASDRIGELVRQGADVYVCTHLLEGRKRSQGASVTRRVVHSDIDHDNASWSLLERLGALVVASGTGGHLHVYVLLDRNVDLATYEMLGKALRDAFGGDHKFKDNDLLRPAGTWNFKEEPAQVRIHSRPTKTWGVIELMDVLRAVSKVKGMTENPSRMYEDNTVIALPDRSVGQLLRLLPKKHREMCIDGVSESGCVTTRKRACNDPKAWV